MAIRITALGTLRVEQDGRSLSRLPAQRVRCALLVYLGVEREATREAAMALLWPDRPSDRARHLLNQTLYELRQELGEGWVETAGDRLVATDELRIDASEFVEAVEAGDYASAVRQYRGRFLETASLGVSRPYEGWTDAQQARLHRLHRTARKGAIETRVELGDLEGALELARSWVSMDPLDDEAQHRLIELLAATGDRSGALRRYDQYAALVAAELDLEPLDETRELAERIREGEVGPRSAAPVDAGPTGPTERIPADAGPAHVSPSPAVIVGPPVAPAQPTRRGTVGLMLIAAAAVAVVGILMIRAESPEDPFPPTTLAAATTPNAFDPRRIAVLYFDDFSEGQELSHLAAGFTENLIDALSQVEELDVVARTAVSHYRDMGGNVLDSIRVHLAPGTVVEGSLMRIGDRIQVTVQLVDGTTASHLMSRTLYGPADSAGLLLRPLAEEAARMLRERLGSEIELREDRKGASSAEAWTLVQRGQQMLTDSRVVHRNDKDAALELVDRVDSLFARAEELDPDWPEPIRLRALVDVNRGFILSGVPSLYDTATTAAALDDLNRLLRRWPNNARALTDRGIYQFELAESGAPDPYRLYEAAEADLRRAIVLDGELPRAWWGLSRVLYRKGEYAEAERAAARALRTDVFLVKSRENLWHLFQIALNLEDFDRARRWCDQLKELHPGTAYVAYCEILLQVASPDVEPDADSAWRLARTIVSLGPRSDTAIFRRYTDLYVARVLIRTGRTDSARAIIDRAVPDDLPGWAGYDLAHVRLLLGDEEGALEALRAYVDTYPGRAQSLDDDWWFRRLHGDPRFEELLGIGPG